MENKLIVLRGNSGSGKSTVATKLRDRSGAKIALVEQDYLRRVVLKEKGETPDGDNIDLIYQTVTFAMGRGHNVILEGILTFEFYEKMLRKLDARYHAFFYYFQISFEETLKRHDTKQNPALKFGEKEMREWYRSDDSTKLEGEIIIPEESSIDEIIALIRADTGL
jgi:predicted kinase